MRRPSSNTLTYLLLGTGAAAWIVTSRPLVGEDSLCIPSNPFGVKRSPYGEVFAMAMQGPIDTYWHGGEDCHDPGCTNPEHHHIDPSMPVAAAAPSSTPDRPWAERFHAWLDRLSKVSEQRTNPKPASPAQRFAIRREIEDKLRFAYELDPSHYANYNAYHLFLTEPELGTRPELTPMAAKLADKTIQYCLQVSDDPRPSLTAASAGENEILLMFNQPQRFTTAQMRQVLGVIDYSLARHRQLADLWTATGNWELVSPLRREEITERYKFVVNIRNSAEATILRLEGKPGTVQVSN
ncbi:hypothetical protein [Luteolibacter sp. LG18]|uniref:hypothetical protein n=1 Tax=Luteolibacter sp. LG18 TaxID=2819286 RepID=UPI002B286080|nr:hypothetical protein llg_29600 [Luteolibacter sp. LG18]